jgi:chromosome segregation ATPase
MDQHKREDDREFIERRLNELDRRRDKDLQRKLDAIEKFFDLSVTTKSEALHLAISRIQGDSKDCLNRCTNQVKLFYDLINGLKDKDTRKSMSIMALKESLGETDKDIVDLFEELAALKLENSSLKSRIETLEVLKGKIETIDPLKTTVTDLASWRENYPIKVVAISVASSVLVIEVIIRGIAWLLDFLSKSKIHLHGLQ